MAKTKKSTRVVRSHEMIDTKTENLMPLSPMTRMHGAMGKYRGRNVLIVVLLLVIGFFAVKKGYVLAAVVNGTPIFRFQLNQQLASRFGTQTLESMITELLIADAAKKEGINVTQTDVATKIDGITQSLGENVNLEELLKYQGMTREDFEHQVRLQLTVERVLGKDVAFEETEIDAFIQTNRTSMTATDEASLRTEAKESLMSQKISENMQPWLTELRDKAKIIKLF